MNAECYIFRSIILCLSVLRKEYDSSDHFYKGREKALIYKRINHSKMHKIFRILYVIARAIHVTEGRRCVDMLFPCHR